MAEIVIVFICAALALIAWDRFGEAWDRSYEIHRINAKRRAK